MWWDGIASTQGSKPDAEQIANREAGSDSSLFAICYGDRGTAKREVPCLPFHHKRHGLRIGSGGRPQAWPYVMLSEQTRHRFHSCRAIVGKEDSPPHSVPELQPYNHRQDAPSRHIVLHQSPDLLSSLDSFCRSTGGKTLALQPGSCSGCFCQQFATFTQVGAGRSTEGNHRFPGKVIRFHKAVYRPCSNSPPDGITDKHSIIGFPSPERLRRPALQALPQDGYAHTRPGCFRLASSSHHCCMALPAPVRTHRRRLPPQWQLQLLPYFPLPNSRQPAFCLRWLQALWLALL